MVAFIHYPPIVRGTGNEVRDTVFLQTLQKYGVKRCYYGHLHGGAHKEACEGEYDGITFKLISGDYTNFSFVKVVWNPLLEMEKWDKIRTEAGSKTLQ